MTNSKDLDFSYSGLKTAVANLSHTFQVKKMPYTWKVKQDLAASIEDTIVKSLINKLTQALKKYPVKDVLVAGGVAANQKLKVELEKLTQSLGIKLHIPPPQLCTDNAAMIASAAFFQKPAKNPFGVQADPNLAL